MDSPRVCSDDLIAIFVDDFRPVAVWIGRVRLHEALGGFFDSG